MHIEEFGPDDTGTVAQVVALDNAVRAADTPWSHPATVFTLTGMLRHGWDGEPPRCFVARAGEGGAGGEDVVGWAELWTSEWDNTDLAWTDLAVHPDRRRRGVGTALLDRVEREATAAGRSVLGASAWDAPPALAFAAAHGLERRSQEIQRRQVLAEVDRDAVQAMYDEARAAAAAYELVRIVGRAPEELIGPLAELTASINDAPTDDLEIEDEVFPPERVRAYEEACLAQDLRLYHLLARHRGSGELAGHTVVAVEARRPSIGEQHDTSVARGHRGHRLGLLLKSAMVLWLAEAEPQLETVDTWNAESNDHMIAVNERLGYRVLGRRLQFQRRL